MFKEKSEPLVCVMSRLGSSFRHRYDKVFNGRVIDALTEKTLPTLSNVFDIGQVHLGTDC